jgi:hypothetical protein
MTDQIQAVLAELERHGIRGRVVRSKNHPRIYFTHQGKEQFYVVPSSGSDSFRGVKNALSDIRRMIGASGARPKSSRPKSRRQKRVDAVPALEAITPGPAGLQALLERMQGTELHRETVRMQQDRGWKSVWSAACREVCGYVSVTAWFRATVRDQAKT